MSPYRDAPPVRPFLCENCGDPIPVPELAHRAATGERVCDADCVRGIANYHEGRRTLALIRLMRALCQDPPAAT